MECPQYSIRLKVFDYLCDCVSRRDQMPNLICINWNKEIADLRLHPRCANIPLTLYTSLTQVPTLNNAFLHPSIHISLFGDVQRYHSNTDNCVVCFRNLSPLIVKFLSSCFNLVCEYCRNSRLTDQRVDFKFLEIWQTEISEIVHYLPYKKFTCLSSCRYCADRVQNLPGPVPDNVFRVLQMSSKSVHFRRSYSETREHRQNAP